MEVQRYIMFVLTLLYVIQSGVALKVIIGHKMDRGSLKLMIFLFIGSMISTTVSWFILDWVKFYDSGDLLIINAIIFITSLFVVGPTCVLFAMNQYITSRFTKRN